MSQKQEYKELDQKIGRILAGKEEPPNKFFKYLAAQTREVRNNLDVVKANIEEGERQIHDLKSTRLRLEGQLAKYLDDMRVWFNTPDEPADDNVKELRPEKPTKQASK